MKKLAIVILNWNGSSLLNKCLPSVIKNSVGDIIVVDNGSSDDSLAILKKNFPDIQTFLFEKNYGYAEGYHLALTKLKGEYQYFLLLNSDVEIHQKGWDQILIDYMDDHPRCAACMPKILDLRKSSSYFEYAGASGGFLDKYGYPFCRGRIFQSVEEDQGQYEDIVPIQWASGAALFLREEDYFEAGGFDTAFFAHMEEIDLCWRLHILEKEVVCIPQSVVYHLGGASLPYGNPKKTFLNFRNSLLMLYKNLPEKELKPVLRTRFFLDFIAALKMILTLHFSDAHAIFRAEADFRKNKDKWKEERIRIQTLRSKNSTKEKENYSILIQYYFKGRKTFLELKKFFDVRQP